MPITIKPAPHPANPVSSKPPLSDPETALLKACLQDKYRQVDHIQESSFFALGRGPANIYPSRNGFVQAAIDAYSYHHHLRLVPKGTAPKRGSSGPARGLDIRDSSRLRRAAELAPSMSGQNP